jgi:hypothetical protein
MERNLYTQKAIMLTIILVAGMNCASIAGTFTASTSGNWSNATTWGGNNPGFNITSGGNVVIPSGVTVVLDSNLVVEGALSLSGGELDLNGQNLTINGVITTTGSGCIIGNATSNISFNGYGGAGNMVFTPRKQVINNLTINIGANSGVFLGSGLTVSGILSLMNGYLGVGDNDLTISTKGNIEGGSSSSYIMTTGTGSLIMNVANSGVPYIFHVGTQNNYAPFAVTNNSATAGSFGVYAFEGLPAGGETVNGVSSSQPMVNTTWNLSSPTISDANINVQAFWSASMQINGFNSSQAYISQYMAGWWSANTPSTAMVNTNGLYSLQLNNVTSLGQFAVFGYMPVSTGMAPISSTANFEVYPNPVSDDLTIKNINGIDNVYVDIVDITGKVVNRYKMTDYTTNLSLSHLAAGNYFVKLHNEQINVVQPIIKM